MSEDANLSKIITRFVRRKQAQRTVRPSGVRAQSNGNHPEPSGDETFHDDDEHEDDDEEG